MTPAQLSRIWTLMSLFLLYYTLNSYIVIQGGQEIFGAKLIMSEHVPAALWAIPICTIVLIVACITGRLYASRLKCHPWHARIPVVGFETIKTESREGRVYQATMLILLAILPAASLIHFWRTVLDAHLIAVGTNKEIASIWDWSYFGWNNPASICTDFTPGVNAVCDKKATVLPGLEPWLFVILTGLATSALIAQLVAIFQDQKVTSK